MVLSYIGGYIVGCNVLKPNPNYYYILTGFLLIAVAFFI